MDHTGTPETMLITRSDLALKWKMDGGGYVLRIAVDRTGTYEEQRRISSR